MVDFWDESERTKKLPGVSYIRTQISFIRASPFYLQLQIKLKMQIWLFSSVQWFSCVRPFATPWTAARQASLSITSSQSVIKLMSIMLVIVSVVSDHYAMNCSLPVSSVHGILQTRILEWASIVFSSVSSQPRHGTQVSCIAAGFFTRHIYIEHHRNGDLESKEDQGFMLCRAAHLLQSVENQP